LARDARFLLTPNIWVGYGATEVDGAATADAGVAAADPAIVGYLFPWVEAEAVDAVDRPLPPGREGLLRLRSAQMIAGYHQDDAATRRNFRDGWFYPGDVGVVTAQRLLRVTGRIEEILVVDGALQSLTPLEEAVRGLPGVGDVALFTVDDPGGGQELGIALVLAPGADPQAVRAEVAARLGARKPMRWLVLDRLPRNTAGKVMRRALVNHVKQGVRP
jgi:acyl-CoA synthetase (AMP-forming)/AMP-acid ligase II